MVTNKWQHLIKNETGQKRKQNHKSEARADLQAMGLGQTLREGQEGPGGQGSPHVTSQEGALGDGQPYSEAVAS